MDGMFLVNSVLLGVGLAMDAFSVSVADAMAWPRMRGARKLLIAGVFAGFQFLMPVIGWACVHAAEQRFTRFQRVTPWIAWALLGVLGARMLREGIRERRRVERAQGAGDAAGGRMETAHPFTPGVLLMQGVATSIDALSVGFTIAAYGAREALLAALVIALVTFAICMGGLRLGRRVGERLAWRAVIVGGVILILIGVEILVRGLMGV